MKHFLNLADLERKSVSALVARTRELKAGNPLTIAQGRTLGLLFFNSSLRTRVSMIGAMGFLGGNSADLNVGQGMWNLATGDAPMLGDAAEHVEEAAGVLGRLCDVLGVRAFASGSDWKEDRKDTLLQAFADNAKCPLINMESANYHPCQALADWTTLDEHNIARDKHFVLSWAYHPKALPQAVPQSTLLMAAQRGMRVTLCRPEGYQLDSEVWSLAQELAKASGGQLSETSDPAAIAEGDVVYAKSWGSLAHYHDTEAERALREHYRSWCVGASGYQIGGDAKAMHCLPVRRDVVMATSLLRSDQSIVLDQAENRKWAQAAVIETMLKG